MAQIVGKECARCNRRIATALEGGFCKACRSPLHKACAKPAPEDPNACPKCGAAGQADPYPKRAGEPREVKGVFTTPQFAVSIRPFPIAGEGRLRFGRDAIEIDGFTVARSPKDLKLLAVVTVVVFVGVFGLVLLAPLLEGPSGSMPIWVWAALLGGTIGYLAKSGRFTMGEANAGDPVSFKLPWRCVANVEIDVKDNVLIDLRHCKPKGRITFLPDEDPELVLDALERGMDSA